MNQRFILIILMITACYSNLIGQVSQTDDNEINDQKELKNSDFQLFSITYLESNAQTPESQVTKLDGVNTQFSKVSTELNYPLYQEKENWNSVLVAGFKYSYLKVRNQWNTTNRPQEEYLSAIPDIHSFYLSLDYAYELNEKWEFVLGSNLFVRTDLRPRLVKKDFNSQWLFYVHRKMNHIGLGLGIISFIVNGEFQSLPLVYFKYTSDRIDIELTPVLLSFKHRLSNGSIFKLSGSLDFSGSSITINTSTRVASHVLSPNFLSTTALDLNMAFDREIVEGLRGAVSLGYLYQEMTFFEGDRTVDILTFDDTLYLAFKMYLIL